MKIHEYASPCTIVTINADLVGLQLDEIWYIYRKEWWEGSGQMIMRKDNLYSHYDLGHNSCCEPTDGVKFSGQPLDELMVKLKKNPKYWEIKIVFDVYSIGK